MYLYYEVLWNISANIGIIGICSTHTNVREWVNLHMGTAKKPYRKEFSTYKTQSDRETGLGQTSGSFLWAGKVS